MGKTFKYTHIDSWEGGDPQSSPVLAAEFKARRGYEFGSKSGIRYTEDFDLTRSELWADNYYGRLSEKSHALNMQTHSEAGGPSVPSLSLYGRYAAQLWITRHRHGGVLVDGKIGVHKIP